MNRQDTALWIAKEGGSASARAALVERYLCLVGQTRLRQFRAVTGSLAEELEGEGRLMLVRCVDEFDRARNAKFSTYAIGKLWGVMAETLRRDDWTPRLERQREKAGLPSVLLKIISLDYITHGSQAEGEPPLTLEDTLPDPAAPVETAVLQHLECESLGALIDGLPEPYREVIERSFWGEETYEGIGRQMHRSESRMFQVRKEGVARLRDHLLHRQARESAEADC